MFRLFGLLLVGLLLSGCDPERTYIYSNSNTGTKIMVSDVIGVANGKIGGNKRGSTNGKLSHMSNEGVCSGASPSANSHNWQEYQLEIKNSGFDCTTIGYRYVGRGEIAKESNEDICFEANYVRNAANPELYNQEIARRQIDCGILGVSYGWPRNKNLCKWATNNAKWATNQDDQKYVREAKRRGLNCGVGEASSVQTASSNTAQSNTSSSIEITTLRDTQICNSAVIKTTTIPIKRYWNTGSKFHKFVEEAARRGLNCRVTDEPNPHAWKFPNSTQTASTTTQSNTPSSAELTAAQKEAQRLRQELAAVKAQQEQQQQTISSDKQKPVINIAGTAMNGPQGTIKGYVRDNTGIAEVRVDGQLVEVDSYGNFMANTYVPQSGINVSIEAVDLAGLTSSMSVRLDRLTSSTSTAITFDRLNPLGRSVASNKDALALIIGVNEYAKTPAKAHYADSDAQVFSDYAIQKLGIPANRVKTLVNNNADESGMLLAVKDWLARANRQGKSDIYIFFAGHGLASDDGEKMYLLPYDGSPRLLSDTAIARERLFADISAANPRSVTVFLDTCYSGTTRGTDMLIASRPIAIRALEQSIPDNFTVMTAAAGDQTAKPLEEAKHGMFSYFLMKGMEGEADANNDNEITAGELHDYVEQNVWQQSSNTQLPQIQGNRDRVLVRFQ